jgi:energy-coupling factor transporter ATP-binding protein EcfA2
MRLTSVEIRDYRSIFADDSGRGLRIDLPTGMTTLVGPNNCGKSNVLRAISLALDPNHRYEAELDVPGPRPFAHPEITLGFQADGDRPEDDALLDAVAAYEQALGIGPLVTRAVRGEVVLKVSFVPTADGVVREELLLTADQRTPTTSGQRRLLEEALRRLRDAVRFVLISSGESIESVLEGNFREILHSVVRERLEREFQAAEESRQQYIGGLQDRLLKPLRDRLHAEIAGLFPEIGDVDLAPEVQSIDRTLARVAVFLDDAVMTPLAGKGTGVRGGLLVAMLSYLSVNATRSMVFALEEPEAFLHPAAQEQLRDHLQELAEAHGVTLLVTTHSPFVLARSASGLVASIAKDREGRTRVAETAAGDADHAQLIGGLMGETTLETILSSATAIPAGTHGIVLVEGDGDRFCLEHAARLVGRPDLLEGIWLRPTGGTVKMVVAAVITKAAAPDLPLAVLVDNDDAGRHVRNQLVGATFGFEKKQFVSYAAMFTEPQWQSFPVEAEDLFPPAVIERFVGEHGTAVIDGSKKRPDGAFHYDLGQAAKEDLCAWLERSLTPPDVVSWVALLLKLRALLGLPADESAEGIVAAAPLVPVRPAADGQALIVTGGHDDAFYRRHGALLLPTDQNLPDDVRHVGFYAGGAVQPEFPAVVADHPHLLLAAAVADQLRGTGKAADERVARLIDELGRADATMTDKTYRVLLLSEPDDPATVVLAGPITNTKQRNGRPLAWTVGTRFVSMASLLAEPTTTDELDALEAKEATA